MNEQISAREIQELLLAYEVALDASDRLPAMVRIAGRPRRWTVFESLRRLPRPTVGVATMVILHIGRSTTALDRRYARLAATKGLTGEDERARALVTSFRDSLPPVRWKIIVPGILIAVLAAIRVAGLIVGGLGVLSGQLGGAGFGQFRESIIRAAAALPSPNSVVDLADQLGAARPSDLLGLTTILALASYLALRPVSAAFRVKRIVVNLAFTGHVDLGSTTASWNATRSVGVYQLERHLFARLGARPPAELDLDLWVGAAPVAALGWWLVTGDPFLALNAVSTSELAVVTVSLLAARIAWLVQTARARRHIASPADPPAGFAGPSAVIVEARSVLETAAIGVASFVLLWVPVFPSLLLPFPAWVRLVRERRDLERAAVAARSGGNGSRLRQLWPALGSAVLLGLVPFVPLAVHLTRLSRLQPAGTGSARRTRTWLVPLAVAATGLAAFDVMYVQAHAGGRWYGVSLLPLAAAVAVSFGAVQREHNALARALGLPLPSDDPRAVQTAARSS